jgi:phytoene dehydrogenase-like protein
LVDPSNSISDLAVKIYEHDKTIAPQGKTVITTLFNADYEYWLNLKKDNLTKYKLEKDRIAAEVIAELDDNLGGIKDKVEVFDVATPYSFI